MATSTGVGRGGDVVAAAAGQGWDGEGEAGGKRVAEPRGDWDGEAEQEKEAGGSPKVQSPVATV